MSQKRAAEDEVVAVQRYRRIRLASPSPVKSSGSDTESIHSYQDYETEFVKDTSDTSSSPIYNIEYDVTEIEERKEKFYLSPDTDESETEFADFVSEIDTLSCESIDLALLGDTSEENPTSPTSNSDVDPGLPRNDYLDFEKCLLCQTDKKNISYPYCSTCFTWKKNLFPSRPKKRQKIVKKDQFNSLISNGKSDLAVLDDNTPKTINNSLETDNLGQTSNLSQEYEDSGVGSSEPQISDVIDGPLRETSVTEPSTSNSRKLTLDMCRVCFVKPENGLFIHLNIAHVYGCYSCAKKIWYHNGGCPICRRKIFKVAKLFI